MGRGPDRPRFYIPKARRVARSSSNVMLAGRTIFFFRRFSKAFSTPYLAPLLTAYDTSALPAINTSGINKDKKPPRCGRRRRRVRLGRRGMLVVGGLEVLFFIGFT